MKEETKQNIPFKVFRIYITVIFVVFLIGAPVFVIYAWFTTASADVVINQETDLQIDLNENQMNLDDKVGKTIKVKIHDGVSSTDILK